LERGEIPVKRPLIQLEDVKVTGNIVIFRVEPSPPLERFLTSGLFYFKYDLPLEGVPEGILSVPLLGCLAPLAWTVGADLVMGEVDSEYLSAVHAIESQMKQWYPGAIANVNITAKPTSTPSKWDESRRGLLYTGGVDSTASMLRNGQGGLSLFMVRGTPEIRLYEARYYQRVRKALEPFVRSLGLGILSIETNALDVINFRLLSSVKRDQFSDGWWENVAHGIVLLSMCAPYTYLDGIGRLLISSSFNYIVKPWGSTPISDELVRWGGLRVVHDSYDLHRVQKVNQVIAPFANQRGGSIPLRVCTGNKSIRLDGGELNCGRCEKCTRTMLQLLFSGVDPARCGFDTSSFVPAKVRSDLESGRIRLKHHPNSWYFMFSIPDPQYKQFEGAYQGLEDFVEWLRGWNFRPKVSFSQKATTFLAPKGSRRREVVRSVLR
jgi:hypothetical protein